MDKREAELLRDSLETALVALESVPRVILQIQANISQVKQMIAEGRNPTDEEMEAQSARLKAQTALLQRVVDDDAG